MQSARVAAMRRGLEHVFLGDWHPVLRDPLDLFRHGFLGAGIGGLFLAAWALTRYTSRRPPRRIERRILGHARG
jgi:hypothetical protein